MTINYTEELTGKAEKRRFIDSLVLSTLKLFIVGVVFIAILAVSSLYAVDKFVSDSISEKIEAGFYQANSFLVDMWGAQHDMAQDIFTRSRPEIDKIINTPAGTNPDIDAVVSLWVNGRVTYRSLVSIAILDREGVEIARLDHDHTNENLYLNLHPQDKSTADYIIGAGKASPGLSFVTSIRLAEEYGDVVYPYQQVRHVTWALRDQDNSVTGYFSVAYHMKTAINNIIDNYHVFKESIKLISGDGTYIVSNSRSDTFGSQVLSRVDKNIKTQYPSVWGALTDRGFMHVGGNRYFGKEVSGIAAYKLPTQSMYFVYDMDSETIKLVKASADGFIAVIGIGTFLMLMMICGMRFKSEHQEWHTKQESKIMSAFTNSLEGQCLLDSNLNIVTMNDALSKMVSLNPSYKEGVNVSKILNDWDDDIIGVIWYKINNNGYWSGDVSFKSSYGDGRRYFHVRMLPIKDDLGGVSHIVAHCSDIDDSKRRINEVELLAKVFDASLGVVIMDSSGVVLRSNTFAAELLDETVEGMLGQNFVTNFSDDGAIYEWSKLFDMLKSGSSLTKGVISHTTDTGEIFLDTQLAKSGDYLVVSFSDITKQKELEAKLRKIADCDGLTNLMTRRAFETSFKRELLKKVRRPSAMSLVLFDADHFKRVNDTYGHDEGDNVLVGIANEMRSIMRKTDYLGRWGGEEFVMLLPDTNIDEAITITKRLQEAVKTMPGRKISVSAGICEWRVGLGIDDLLQKADGAMYQAKINGRDRIEITK